MGAFVKTTKSSEANVLVLGATDNSDMVYISMLFITLNFSIMVENAKFYRIGIMVENAKFYLGPTIFRILAQKPVLYAILIK